VLSEEQKDAVRAINEALTEALSEGLGASVGKPDWIYRDLPRMKPELLAEFKEIVGQDNLHWVTFADYGETVRGQILISPAGMERMRAYRPAPMEERT